MLLVGLMAKRIWEYATLQLLLGIRFAPIILVRFNTRTLTGRYLEGWCAMITKGHVVSEAEPKKWMLWMALAVAMLLGMATAAIGI